MSLSQVHPFKVLPRAVQASIGNPGVAALLDTRGMAPMMQPVTSLSGHGLLGSLAAAAGRNPPDLKVNAALAAFGLEPKSAKLFNRWIEQQPPENQAATLLQLGQFEKAAQEAVGKPAFEVGVFVIGAREQYDKLTDGKLSMTARLSAGGTLAADGAKALAPYMSEPAHAEELGDLFNLLTVPDALSKLRDPDLPAFRRFTLGGRLLMTGLTFAAHFVPVLSAHAGQFRTITWLCNVGDKSYAALIEVPKPAGNTNRG